MFHCFKIWNLIDYRCQKNGIENKEKYKVKMIF